MRSFIITLLSLLLLSAAAMAQPQFKMKPELVSSASYPFALGKIVTINSPALSENRTLNIYLPDAYYTNKTDSFPVIYLLDGSADEDFIHITGLTQFLTMINVLPPSIVVGIANVDRKRDFVHPLTKAEDIKLIPTAGGSEKFMNFIEYDLQPYIQRTYRTGNRKTIIGQSLGGLFATQVLLERPSLFTDYIIVSPSLWVNDESLLKKAPQLLRAQKHTKENVYLSVGSEGDQMIHDTEDLVILLNKYATERKITYYPMPAENHLTILHNSVYKALEVLNKK